VRGVGLENDGCNTVGNDLRICETSINLESTEAGFAKSRTITPLLSSRKAGSDPRHQGIAW
jgi:hypothetical protein